MFFVNFVRKDYSAFDAATAAALAAQKAHRGSYPFSRSLLAIYFVDYFDSMTKITIADM